MRKHSLVFLFIVSVLAIVPLLASVEVSVSATRTCRTAGEWSKAAGLPVYKGTVWTTDAPYRETRQQLDQYGEEGVLAVEM